MNKIAAPATDTAAELLLENLVSAHSPSYQEGGAVRVLVDWMNAHGYDRAFIDEAGNAVGIIGQGDQEVVLLGHIDTFPGDLPVYRDGRLLYGRGSVDAKGPLATFAAAGARALLPDHLRLVVIGAVEEEAPTSKGARYAAAQYQPQACIIGEPSNWDRITLGYKGRLLLDWHWRGPLAHSAGQATSPAEHAVDYWQRIGKYVDQVNDGKEAVFARLDASLQAINTQDHGAYGEASLTAGFRLPPTLTPEEVEAALQPQDGATVRARGQEIAFVSDRDHALSRAMRGAIRAQGGNPRFVYKTGTSDMNVVGPIWSCPIVAYGPGDSALDHTPEEHLDLDEYLHAVNVLTQTLERIRF
ncbi:MAG: [LysW]-lysine hydrolase [Anaerolineae bacterium]|nr:[LysW]-lysine hydrolase [Anaerolineae bacterium]